MCMCTYHYNNILPECFPFASISTFNSDIDAHTPWGYERCGGSTKKNVFSLCANVVDIHNHIHTYFMMSVALIPLLLIIYRI